MATSSVRPTPLTWILVVLGVLCLVLAVVYWTHGADALPSFLPGFDAARTRPHHKHGIAAAILGVVLLVGAWMTTGSRKATTAA